MTENKTSKAAIVRTPLNPRDLERAEVGARRLSAALADVILRLPEAARTTGGLARYLEVDRSTSQRVVAASKVRGDYLYVYSRMPGIEGLRRFLEAARAKEAKEIDEQQLDHLAAAITCCAELVSELAGSLAGLTARIRAVAEGSGEGTGSDAERLALRRQLFEAGRTLCGQSVDVFLTIMAMRTSPENPERLQCARLMGYVGLSGRANGMPLVRSSRFRSGDGAQIKGARTPLSLTSDESAVGLQTGALLERFCSDPLPRITSRVMGDHMVQMIDLDRRHSDKLDIVLGSRLEAFEPHPTRVSPSFFRFAQGVRTPARQLVMDLWQERSLARASIPSCGVYRTTPSSPPEIQDRWYERYSDCPRLEHLGHGLARAASSAHARHAALTEYLFQCLGWPADDFVGVRVETEFPIWNGDYQIVVDFSEGEAGQSG